MHKLNIDDAVIIQEYEHFENCREVAARYGCCDETVRRILIKHGIPLTHRHPKEKHQANESRSAEMMLIAAEYNDLNVSIRSLSRKYHRSQTFITRSIKEFGNGLRPCERNEIKISDDELIACANDGMSCSQIAAKYSMSAERVYRRARKLHLHLNDRGRGGHWKKRSDFYGCEYFDSSITLEKVIERDHGICQICGLYVDKTDIDRGHIKRMYPTVDHIIPLSKGGTHTWDNVQLAHMMCNAGKCDKANTR